VRDTAQSKKEAAKKNIDMTFRKKIIPIVQAIEMAIIMDTSFYGYRTFV